MKLLVINGPNLNLLGVREPDLYGRQDYAALVKLVEDTCAAEGVEVEVYQSNHEGDLVDRIQAAYGVVDGIVINLPAYLEGLPQEAWMSEFVPIATESSAEDEEVPGGDEFEMEDLGDF